MRISPITTGRNEQYKYQKNSNIAFTGFWRDLKNAANSALDTGVKVVTGQIKREDAPKDFAEGFAVRDNGYGIGGKEAYLKKLQEKEQELEKEREAARKIEEECKKLAEQERLDNLSKPYKETLEEEFFSVVELSQKDPTIIPPNGILIETPEPFNIEHPRICRPDYFHNPIMMAFRYCVEHHYPMTEENLAKLVEKFRDEQDREMHKIIEYEDEYQKYKDRIQTQELIEQYLKDKQNINKFLVTSLESVEHLGSALSCTQNEYLKNGKHSLIFIEGFENIGKETPENKKFIAGLKSIMCSCAEKYHTSLLLKIAADKLKSIDPILLVDSRVPIKIKF